MSESARDPARATPWYALSRFLTFSLMRAAFRLRRDGSHHIPARGPALLIANHQSYIDPPVVATLCMHRAIHFIARFGLFKNPLFSRLITSYNSIPIREDTGDVAAMKEAIRRLEQGAAVLVFPEGSRTTDGSMTEFKRGISILLKRAQCPVIPVAIEGAFDAWPRSRKWPRWFTTRIACRAAAPILHEELLRDGPDAALRRLESIIDAMRLDLRAELRSQTRGMYPPTGPGDRPSYSSSNDASSCRS